MTEAVPLSNLALLNKLQHFLKQRGAQALWGEALPWLRTLCQADAVGLIYTHEGVFQTREGTVSPDVNRYLDEWVAQWLTPAAKPSADTLPPADMVQDHRTPDGARLVHIPLLVEGRALGGLMLVYTQPEKGEIARHPLVQMLVRTVAYLGYLQDQLLYSQRRLDQVGFFYQIGQNLASNLNLRQVLRETIELTVVVLDAEAATLFLLDEERQELVFAIPTGEKGDVLREYRIPVGQGIAGWVVQTGQSVIVNDVQQDPRFLRDVDSTTGFTTRNVLCVPLQYRGRIIGALETLNKRSPTGFTEEDRQWLEMLATQAAIAIENARLYEQLREERDRIVAAQEGVRHRLAQGLHDGPAQDLARLLLDIDYIRRLLEKDPSQVPQVLDEMEALARQAHRSIRQFLFELRPVILETRGLVAAVRSYLEQWQASEALRCHLDVRDFPADLDTRAAGAIFAIIQESFNNLRKHAQATEVWVRLERRDDMLRVEIEDNGVGFNVEEVWASYEDRHSYGLWTMREQAELLDGRLIIESPSPRLGRGTRVVLEVPYERVRRKREDEG